MMDITVPFYEVFDFIFLLYRVIMNTGILVWNWLGSTVDETLAGFLEIPLDTTNLEVMFGSILIFSLIMAAVKLFSFLG